MDDIGASSKQFEVYSRYPFCNFLFLKRVWPLKSWGPYPEIRLLTIYAILDFLERHKAKLTVAVTASWVERDGSATPFHLKWPDEATAWRQGYERGLIEIANHGLTHCVPGLHRPRWFQSNRRYHREFWPWVPDHHLRINTAQRFLAKAFGVRPTVFVPPGNQWTKETRKACDKLGLRFSPFIENRCIIFHDRDIAHCRTLQSSPLMDAVIRVTRLGESFGFVSEVE